MGNLFRRHPKPEPSRVTEADKAVLQLKQQRDKLKQYQKKLNLALERERQLAKKLLSEGKQEKAKLLLRKKKYQEGLIDKTDNQLHNIEQLVHDLEFAQIETQVLEGLKKGNESLKKMHELVSLEEVEQIMDETSEAVEYQRQISDLLSGSLTAQDEQDVLDELSELLAEESEEQGEPIKRQVSDKKAEEPMKRQRSDRSAKSEAEEPISRQSSGKVVLEDIHLPDVPDDELPAADEPIKRKSRAKEAMLAS